MLDIVPNHMAAAGRQNRWWWDVLTNGQHSCYATFFDIRWDHPDPLLRGKVLLPVLGDEIERCLESRQIQVRRRRAEIHVAYFEHEFPVSALSLLELLQAANRASANHSLARFAEMLAADISRSGGAFSCEPPPDERTRTQGGAMEDAAAAALDASIAAANAEPVRLKRILDLQYYRLAFWRRANRDLNYRRFFDIHQLAGVCVEKEEVFAATHEMVLRWINEGPDRRPARRPPGRAA